MTVSFFFITSSKEVFKCLTWYTFFVFGFVLLPFQNYWISPRFSLPFFSSFHYKLRLLIPPHHSVKIFCRGKFNKSGYEKCSVWLKPQSQKFKSIASDLKVSGLSSCYIHFCKICNQCNEQFTNHLWILLDSICLDWLYTYHY